MKPDIRRLIEKKKEAFGAATEEILIAGSVCREHSIKPNVFRPGVKAVDLGFGESFFASSQTLISLYPY